MNLIGSRLAGAVASVLLLLPLASPAADTYDISRDFLTVTNPGAVWSFGWKSSLGGAFNLLSYHGAAPDSNGGVLEYWYRLQDIPSSVYRNSGTNTVVGNGGAGIYPPGAVWFGPGFNGNPDNFSVIRFSAPAGGGGSFKIAVAVQSRLNGPGWGDSDFHVVSNGREVFSQNVNADSSASYTNILTLGAGDTIDFMVGRGADGTEYGGGLKIAAVVTGLDSLTIRVSQVELCWPTESNKLYQVQYRSSLTTNEWLPLGTNFISGTGAICCTNDTVPVGEPRRFYQVISAPGF